MAGNSIGKEFVVTSFGESHGKCIGVVVDGCPAGLSLNEKIIQTELDRRVPTKSPIVSGRKEKDKVEILSGVFNGFTTGAPICMLVRNEEARSHDYKAIKNLPRPGHADYTAHVKYGGHNDYRGGGRFSGRVTVALIMAGAIAKELLKSLNAEVLAYTKAIGKVKLTKEQSYNEIRRGRYETTVRCPDFVSAVAMEAAILKAKAEGDSIGGIIECVALNVKPGLGEPIFDSLDADISKMLFTIPAIKGVEFGIGFKAAELKGSKNNDPYLVQKGKISTLTNNSGGILGGISSGSPIIVRVAVKPTSSIGKEQRTIDLSKMEAATLKIGGRHDPCVVPKAVPVVESAVAIVLVDYMIRAGLIPKTFKR